ncbi:DUF3800 domain-containing protein [uncultured Variovorax sp.]|uniref:DUF3800 domain-containing protein n=1 Tax=uncultured Variovorax sp. TaxID=114708 RepID=UPI0025FBC271|nr:DUF3800 domain-containing protein [uncultured Variovorax sp.]
MPSKPIEQFDLFVEPPELSKPNTKVLAKEDDSPYIVYVDESGDHSLTSIDDGYPVFVLAFCVFHKEYYANKVVPSVEHLKFRNFGHDIIVLHESDIRKELPPFNVFANKSDKEYFFNELNEIILASKFILISSVIFKKMLPSRLAQEANSYHLALQSCLETLYDFLIEKGQEDKRTHVVVECRGKKEDNALELEFRRICDGSNRFGKNFPFSIVLADKKTNSTGLQFADLVARPIGRHLLNRGQANRAFDILRAKFFCRGGRERVGRDYEGWGLKIIPAPESEKPR